MKQVGKSKQVLLIFLSLMMLGSLPNITSSAEGIPDEQYQLPQSPNSTMIGVQFLGSLFTNIAGFLAADATPRAVDEQNYSTVAQALCTSVDDAACKAGVVIYFFAHLPKCIIESDVDCVGGIFAIKPDGVRVEGTFVRNIPEMPLNPCEGNSTLGVPTSGVDGLWTLPGVINGSGSDTYLVIAEQSGRIDKERNSSLTQRIPPDTFNAGIVPVKMINGSYKPSYVGVKPTANGTERLFYAAPTGINTYTCAGVSTSECARREAFPTNTVFGLSLRLSGEIKGWLVGRIRDPLIQYRSSSNVTSITVQALPVSFPVVTGWTERANLPAVIPGAGIDPPPGTGMVGSSSGDFSLNLLRLWLPLIGDKAQANPTAWNFSNLPYSDLPGANACMFDSKSLAGFVSTNSTVFTAGPPLYNPDTGSIDYKLVSPHFTSKGEVFKGTYSLTIRSDVARCIYKFTNAPLKATISVTDDSGQASVAVESMSEHDGWIYLSASGFTFSSPTVHVKLIGTPIPVTPVVVPGPTPLATPSASPSSEVTPIVTSTPTPTPLATSAKPVIRKSTITCINGISVKKVTAIKPICPKGFKKK